jgi:hypothetical protein
MNDQNTFADQAKASAAIDEKLTEAMTPGCDVEFGPDEAERAGAFVEDALTEHDAAESAVDLADASAAAPDEED